MSGNRQGSFGNHEGADALLRAVSAGDRAAFAELYDLVISRVFGLVTRVIRDQAMAEEVTQEAMVEVWQKAATFDSTVGRALPWIMTIAHRRAVDRVRSEEASKKRDDRYSNDPGAPEFDVIDLDDLSDRLQADDLTKALGRLSEPQREAIVLAYYGGLSYPDVARQLDVPLGTVKTRIRDGLLRLRDNLGVTP